VSTLFNIVPNCIKASSPSTSESYNALRLYNAAIVLGINDVGYGSTSDLSFWNGFTPPYYGYTIYIPNQGTTSTISTQICYNDNQLINIASELLGSKINNVFDALISLIGDYNCVVMNYNLPDFPTNGLVAFVLSGFSQSFPEQFSGVYTQWWSSNTASIVSPTYNYFLVNTGNITMDGTSFALALNGTQYFTINDGDNIPIGNSDYTMACWFNTNTLGANGLIGWGNYGTDNQANAFRITTEGELDNYWWANDLVTSGLNLQTGTWYCAICTYNSSTNTRTIYLNGSNVAQDNPIGVHNVTTAANTTIGYTGTGSDNFDGLMLNAAIYNEAFTDQNALDYYNAILPLVSLTREFNLLTNPLGAIATTQSIQNINIQH
jgi:hypothetical protein